MTKKRKKKGAPVARSELLLAGVDQVVLVRETYQTIKKRLVDVNLFVEITDLKGKKALFNKQLVSSLLPRV